ncbi:MULTISPECIES: methyl-accepting chemotaxis protein [Thermoanaerobacter]|uniref:Putative methyl-accepting chemotaxis sensory transducer n=2 Tax=Thermoanaerobacteraceae TaxID=186814 RepID=G2MXW6_9THEO|nr:MULTISPECIES: methyl-accepting chemotaxis protein [Thermoanaerobacter]ABY92052.1 putative methyl-accepting chemotaxis sensory transducer [Thermoanaerobacter sp. X514]AEM79714.1 putative methyl-accepting chemotaxis sensory transducer [Thermoanaerobacter wiegelii Rt8.B1]
MLTVISIIVGFAITKLLGISMKQINVLVEKLSNYDFTVEIDNEGKNEFAEMNSSFKISICERRAFPCHRALWEILHKF